MKWKEFFRLTNQKIKITVYLFIFFFLLSNLQSSLESSILDLSAFILTFFLVLIIFYYLVACGIVKMFEKRGRK